MPDKQDPLALPANVGKVEPPTVAAAGGAADPPVIEATSAGSDHFENVRPFGDYELLGEIGRGGMGVVYRARDRHSGHLVALKMMLTERTQGANDLRRFTLEARAAGELNHSGIVAIHAWGEHDGHPFYTMDFIDGVPLNRLIDKGPLPADRAVRYLAGVARAVAAAHALNIVHRDLKPSNVIIDANDQPRILDFGLAKRQRVRVGDGSAVDSMADALPANATMDAPLPAVVPGGSRLSRATQEGVILGTPTYMAPEQARGEHSKVGPAADVHALGVIFYEMLVGRPPYQGGSVMDTLMQVIEREPPSMWVEGKRVPAVLEAVCRRCLQKDPKARYADAGVLADDLEKRWDWTRQGPRYARLALAAGLAGTLLAGLRLFLPHWLPSGLAGWAGELTKASGPGTEEAAAALALLLDGVVFIGAPLMALFTTLVALAGWVWHSNRAWPISAVCVTAAACAWLSLLVGQGVPQYLAAGFLSAVALVALATWAGWHFARPGRADVEVSSVKTEPFLQRLFGVGGERSSRKGERRTAETLAGLGDFERLKVLHRWPGGQVQRGRQKSLDRPVLIWQETAPAAADAPWPGVLVRHPDVLGLHAVVAGPEGRFLITEHAAAVPLAELLQRDGLQPRDAVRLAVRVAQALQAFHDLGTCHGRLGPEWILIHGETEPLLCPCGVPSPSAEERARDCAALGRLLEQWLPPRPRGWLRQPFGAVYQVCDAAGQGNYPRPVDLAGDLERALQQVVTRHRERWAIALVALLAALPVLALAVELLLDRLSPGTSPEGSFLAAHLLLALAPGASLLGFYHGRALVHRYRLRLRHATRCFRLGQNAVRGLTQLALLSAAPFLLMRSVASSKAPLLPAMAVVFGYWFVGSCLAGLVSAGESLLRNFQPKAAGNPERYPWR